MATSDSSVDNPQVGAGGFESEVRVAEEIPETSRNVLGEAGTATSDSFVDNPQVEGEGFESEVRVAEEIPETSRNVPGEAGTSVTLTASTEYSCYSPARVQQCWGVATFKAPFYEPSIRASVDVVAVIDKSGSMRGQKIALVKETLLFVIDQLKDTDRICLVLYDTNVKVVFGLMKMTDENREKAKTFVSSIKDGSSTNLSGGLLKGMEQVALTNGQEKAQIQSVLLLTDGLANHGITSKTGILNVMEQMQKEGLGAVQMPPEIPRQHRRPQIRSPRAVGVPVLDGNNLQQQMPELQVPLPAAPKPEVKVDSEDSTEKEKKPTAQDKFDGTVYTFGFGSDHDAGMLVGISTQGGGVYYYIDTNEKIPESFADCLGGLLSVMGQNVTVKLEALGDTTFKKVHTSKDVNWTTPNKICEVNLGDIQSEESRDLVLELELPAISSSDVGALVEAPVVNVQVSYFNVITSQFDTVDYQLTTSRTDGDRGLGNKAVDIQRNRVQTGEALKRAEELGSQNKLDEAKKMLRDCISALESSISKEEGLVKLLLLDLNQCLSNMSSKQAFESKGKKYMKSKMQSHAMQRSNFVYGEDDQEVEEFGYGNMSKAMFRSKAKKK